jgi:hypothetical protein
MDGLQRGGDIGIYAKMALGILVPGASAGAHEQVISGVRQITHLARRTSGAGGMRLQLAEHSGHLI